MQFLVSEDSDDPAAGKLLEDVRKELDYYLVEKGEPNPWGYAIYHSGTSSNLYSKVHWSYWTEEHKG